RRILADLEDSGGYRPVVPIAKIVHDRLGIEIARGCTRGCRFCQAGIIYRPVRERSLERIIELAEKGIAESGFDEVALLSLSTGDYSCISDLMVKLMDRLVRDRVSVSMPSMRVGSLTPEMMEQIRRVRKSGFTLAPEAGTDRLRQVINKGITEEDLLSTSRAAFELGWKLLKFYFMFGLPTETDEDLAAIPQLVRRALQEGDNGRQRINVSVGTFVPKPHTPFQRARQLGIDEGFAKIDFLKKELRTKRMQLKWHDPRQSYLEGVMSRGDRRLSLLIEEAWRRGARLDAWNEHFNLDRWQTAADECGIDLDRYLRERGVDEPLPWDHLDCGVDLAFIAGEAKKAKEGIYTPDCRIHGCQECGLCDFKTIKPRVAKSADSSGKSAVNTVAAESPAKDSTPNKFVYRIDYSRIGLARFLGHLEMIQMFYRVLRRAGLPINFSQGFNPTQRVTFSPALPLGTESLAEHFLIEVNRPLAEPEKIMETLNRELPEGFEVLKVGMDSGQVEQRLLTCYHVRPMVPIDSNLLAAALTGEEMTITVMRKGRARTIDARPMVRQMIEIEDGVVELQLETETGKAALKPMEIISAVLCLSAEEAVLARIRKIWCHGVDKV
ncbi:MAG: TIGR03936 family radical SAM-associated protein, partial [Thermodesulfobacteriota bacterium]